MRILFVAEYYFANPDFVRLSRELSRRGHQVTVATSRRKVDQNRVEEGISIFNINPIVTMHSVPHSLSFPISKIYRIARKQNVDVVHALSDYSTNSAVAALVSRLRNVPFVYTIQGLGTRTKKPLVDALAEIYDRSVESVICGSARKVILLSNNLVPRARKLGIQSEKFVVVPSGVDHETFNPEHPELWRKAEGVRRKLGIRKNSIVVGYVGRLVPAKGLSFLLEAAARAKQTHPNIVLLLVGEGSEKGKLEARAEELGTEAHFAGYQTDTPPYYALMDVFVLPSFFEGLPGVVLEAMAMEKPVVATNVGGTPDLILNGENGFLIPPGDSEKMTTALEKLISDEALRAKMGKMNREIVKERFFWNSIVDRVEMVYKEAV